MTASALDQPQVMRILEAALLAADQPLTVDRLVALFDEGEVDRQRVRDALGALEEACRDRGYELKQVASGYRFQVRQEFSLWISRMWEERPPRYSRALMETLALIAYRQPVTRGDIEEVRGVAVSSNIVRTLLERDWIRVVGYREVPGRPALYATTKAFLDYFNLKGLDELPPLAEIRALTEPHVDELVQAGPEYAEGLTLDAEPCEAEDASGDAVESDDDAPSHEEGVDARSAARADRAPEQER
jgi:segregation and condensation protein B